jgi:hypothetical protein
MVRISRDVYSNPADSLAAFMREIIRQEVLDLFWRTKIVAGSGSGSFRPLPWLGLILSYLSESFLHS